MKNKMCAICGEHPAEYQCDLCGALVCQHCWASNGLCEQCMQNIEDVHEVHHSLYR